MKYKNRVKDTSASSGLVDFVLDSAVASGFRNISQAYVVDDYLPYTAVDTAGNWEVGVGKYAAGSTLEREFIFESTNANSFVSFVAGGVEIQVTPYAQKEEFYGYTVKRSANQNIFTSTDTNIIWDGVVDDPNGYVTSKLPLTYLTAPPWIDLIEVTVNLSWSSMVSPSSVDLTQMNILDANDVEIDPPIKYKHTVGGGVAAPDTLHRTRIFTPRVGASEGFAVSVYQDTGDSAQIDSNTTCQVRFVQ